MYNINDLYLTYEEKIINDLPIKRVRIVKRIILTSGVDELKFKDIFDNTIISNPNYIKRLSSYYSPLSFKNGCLFKSKKELFTELLEFQLTTILLEIDTESIKNYLECIGCYENSKMHLESFVCEMKKNITNMFDKMTEKEKIEYLRKMGFVVESKEKPKTLTKEK